MISKEIYKELEEIVGPDNISQDRDVCQAYVMGGDRAWHNTDAKALSTIPEIVLLPGSTEEVQKIVKVACKHKITYTPSSTFWFPTASPSNEDALLLDLKRMKHFEIDAKNMNATVGPGINFGQLQAEAMNNGLYTMVPGGGSQVGVIANTLIWGYSPLTYRTGLANRRIMGAEWILPDGEIVQIGSLASGEDGFWGEGIGPDLRGILRGSIGWHGSMGIVTKMTVKLFPFHEEKLVPVGTTPWTFFLFPEERMKWYNFTCPDKKTMVDFMYDIGHCEIGAANTRVPISWRYMARARDKEKFHEIWMEDREQKRKEVAETAILRVMLIGYTSRKQLQYEEKVLMQIAENHGCEHRRTRQVDGSWMQSCDAVTMWWLTGANMSVTGQLDSLDCSVKMGEKFADLKEKYTPPLMDDHHDPGWFQLNDFGHNGYLEFMNYAEPYETEENVEKILDYYAIAGPKIVIDAGALSFFNQAISPASLDGPNYGPNFHLYAKKVKDAFDPEGLANPPGILDRIDTVIDRIPVLKAKKDW